MKHMHSHDFEEKLKQAGLKVTNLRLAVLKTLSKTPVPLNAEDLSLKIKTLEFDRATLFRTLKTFIDHHLITAIDLGENSLRYELNCEIHHHHHHIICPSCKKIETVPFCVPQEFKDFLTAQGYRNIAHRMDFSGICKNCY